MEITVRDFLRALERVNQRNGEKNEKEKKSVNNNALLKYDLNEDLHIQTGKVASVVRELQQVCSVELPVDIYKVAPNNSVHALVNTINQYIHEYDDYREKNG